MKFPFFSIVPVVAITTIVPLAAWAGFFGDHPRYEHALSDLRAARHFLQRPEEPNVAADEGLAVHEIDLSIGEIKEAAAADWKETWTPPNIDAHLNHGGRLHEALKLLERAHDDVAQEEDDHYARGLRNRAIGHMDRAISMTKRAIGDKIMDED
jgi:tetratricopeptide (TPR) repeat protein